MVERAERVGIGWEERRLGATAEERSRGGTLLKAHRALKKAHDLVVEK